MFRYLNNLMKMKRGVYIESMFSRGWVTTYFRNFTITEK